MTIHSAKGLEANNVFIDFNVIWKYLNDKNSFSEFNKIYVAISRAKKKIFFVEQ